MDELLVALFDNQERAREAARLLHERHAGGCLSMYALAIVVRAPNGAGLAPSEPVSAGKGAAAPAVAAAVGALVSLLGGAIPAVLRTVRSGLVSAVSELSRAGLDSRFLERISHDLRPGGAAVIAEVEEANPLLLDARIAALGGHAFRHRLEGPLAEARIEREVAALRDNLAKLRAGARDMRDAPALRDLSRARAAELRQARRRAGALADALRREGVAKIAMLRVQSEGLSGDARAAVESRAATVRASFEARASRLDQLAEHG
jgi:uncharacterized membrane protein